MPPSLYPADASATRASRAREGGTGDGNAGSASSSGSRGGAQARHHRHLRARRQAAAALERSQPGGVQRPVMRGSVGGGATGPRVCRCALLIDEPGAACSSGETGAHVAFGRAGRRSGWRCAAAAAATSSCPSTTSSSRPATVATASTEASASSARVGALWCPSSRGGLLTPLTFPSCDLVAAAPMGASASSARAGALRCPSLRGGLAWWRPSRGSSRDPRSRASRALLPIFLTPPAIGHYGAT